MKTSRQTDPQATAWLGDPAYYGSYAVKRRIAKIDETVDLKGKHVLDLGCGNGCYTEELARRAAKVCGIDIRMSHLEAFRARIPRVQAAGENLPFAPESFDAVTMIEVLEHTHCDGKVLEECFRVLKPGGLLILLVPGISTQAPLLRSNLYSPQTSLDGSKRRVSKSPDRIYFSAAGLISVALQGKLPASGTASRKVAPC
jgi:ubiquinone/menaquinone biosynthesis C-methylase UbiE